MVTTTRCRLWWTVLVVLLAEPAWAQSATPSSSSDRDDPAEDAAAGAAEETSDDDSTSEADDEEDEPSYIEVRARAHAGWTLEHLDEAPVDGSDQTTNTFFVRRARLKIIGKPTDWLRGVVNIDASAILDLGGSILRDAYVHVEALPQLELRAGQFKKPFSRLELRSPAKLKVIERGEGNELIVEDLGYGDRDLGIRASGELLESIGLQYALGVFNGSGPNYDDIDVSKDLVARVEVQPAKWISAGANGSFKFFADPEEGQPDGAWAAGVDLRLKLMGLRLHLEGLLAEDHEAWRSHTDETEFTSPLAVGVVGILSQRHDLGVSWGLALEPVFKVEFLDPDVDIVSDDVMLFTPGLNAYFGDNFRLMTQAEFRSAQRNSADSYESRKTFTMLACFDL